MLKNLNIWFLSSLLVSIGVLIPIVTVFFSFFEETSNYYQVLKDTFLFEYIFNSFALLFCVLILTFIIGTTSAYLVSFYKFPFSDFFKWVLILSFAVPPYIYAYSLTAFFENYGTAFTILTNLFGEGEYNKHIPKFDGLLGAVLSLSFSLYAYVYILSRASFLYQSQNLIDLGRSLGFSKFKSLYSLILPAARPAIVAGLSLVAMETLAEFAQGVATAINAVAGGQIETNDVLQGSLGVVLNPNTELMFQGFSLRSFGLKFKMSARNEKETKAIRQIAGVFKKVSLPTYGQEAGGLTDISKGLKNLASFAGLPEGERTNNNYIGVPGLVQVSFMRGNELHPFLPQYKTCAISSVEINYTPDGTYSTLDYDQDPSLNGAPVAVELSLGFSETKLIYSDEIVTDGVSY